MDDLGAFLFGIGILAAILWFSFLNDSQVRYYVQYYGAELIYVDKPHDCEFLTAPIGKKHCSYQAEVSIIRYGADNKTQEPIVSYDEGKTWHWNSAGPTEGGKVHVRWAKRKE